MKVWGKLLTGFMLIVGATSALAAGRASRPYQPVALNSTDTCVIPKIDDERVPFPLRQANTKFELSEGQTYLLNGTLVVMDSTVYLKVDFGTQPWLATDRMVAFPYLEVSTLTPSAARQYGNQLVQIAVVATRESSSTTRMADLKLSSLLPPVTTTPSAK